VGDEVLIIGGRCKWIEEGMSEQKHRTEPNKLTLAKLPGATWTVQQAAQQQRSLKVLINPLETSRRLTFDTTTLHHSRIHRQSQ
jgi:hypothetical protein